MPLSGKLFLRVMKTEFPKCLSRLSSVPALCLTA